MYDDQELSYHIEQLNQSDNNDNNLTTICDVNSKYYEMEDMQHISPKNIKPILTALHINIHSLPAKFDQLNLLLCTLIDNIYTNITTSEATILSGILMTFPTIFQFSPLLDMIKQAQPLKIQCRPIDDKAYFNISEHLENTELI